MPIKSFRGQIENDGSDTISLHTNNGSTGYRIKKIDTFPVSPGSYDEENILKIYTIPQTTVTDTVDFSDNTLIAAAFLQTGTAPTKTAQTNIVFDNVTFNQDIYITAKDMGGSSRPINYYIELELVKLDLNQNTMATLKDIKNIEQRSQI
jgi:hypothetical protein